MLDCPESEPNTSVPSEISESSDSDVANPGSEEGQVEQDFTEDLGLAGEGSWLEAMGVG